MGVGRICWQTARRELSIAPRALVMGVLNCTPDSFSDGGKFLDPPAAVAHGVEMFRSGADIIDVGGESTRPGSRPVPDEQQIARTIPVIRQLAERIDAVISIDTQSAVVAREALRAGAGIVNDISALRGDADMASVAADWGAGVVLMHMRGTPRTMQEDPRYDDVVRQVRTFLAERVGYCEQRGIDRHRIAVDPGIGFGKTVEHNLTLLRRLQELADADLPILVGTSRKRFIGEVLGVGVKERVAGTLATVAWAVIHGASIVRVHDVPAARQTVEMLAAIARSA